MARATSVRPAPTRPLRPTISPLRTSKLMSVKRPGLVRFSTLSATSPIEALCFFMYSRSGRPIISLMMSASLRLAMWSVATR